MKCKIVEDTAHWLGEIEAQLLDPLIVCDNFHWPDFDQIDKALLAAIDFDPPEAMRQGLLCPVVDLLSYGGGNPKDGSAIKVAKGRHSSRYGHGYRKLSDGFELLPVYVIKADNKPDHDYTGFIVDGFGIDGCGDRFKTDADRSLGCIMVHTSVGHFPGLELTRVWSKVFDAERNQRGRAPSKYIHRSKQGKRIECESWVDKDGKIVCAIRNSFTGELKIIAQVNHFVDHPYGNTGTLQPGFRAAISLRTLLPDVNDANKHHDHTVGDFLCFGDFTGYQLDHFDGDWDKLIKDGWVNMMTQAMDLRPCDGFRFKDPALWCKALSA